MEHSHAGDATYIAYTAMQCRHADCLAAFNEYKLRLAERKLRGDFTDLRLRANRLAEARRPATPEPAEDAAQPPSAPLTAMPEAPANPRPDEAILELAMRVLNSIRLMANPVSGVINDQIYNVRLVAAMTKLAEPETAELIDMLFRIGAIETVGHQTVLTGIEPILTETKEHQ